MTLGAGYYPEEPEDAKEMTCYSFKASVGATLTGYVYARNKEEAESFIMDRNYDEEDELRVDEVLNIEEIDED